MSVILESVLQEPNSVQLFFSDFGLVHMSQNLLKYLSQSLFLSLNGYTFLFFKKRYRL